MRAGDSSKPRGRVKTACVSGKEPNPTGGELVHGADEPNAARREGVTAERRGGEAADRRANVGLDGVSQLHVRRLCRIDALECRKYRLEERPKGSGCRRSAAPRLERRLNRAASLVTQHHEQRRGEVRERVPEAIPRISVPTTFPATRTMNS